MKIKVIYKQSAIDFIRKYHYSNILPRLTKHYLGFYNNKELVGVVTLGWGTQPLQTIKKIFPNEELKSENYLEIGKMCFIKKNNNDKKSGSIIISMLRKWIKQNLNIMFLYTLADGIMGKVGYVYQASSFTYIGYFMTSVYLDNNTMEKIHPRSAKKLCIENAKYEKREKIFWLTQSFCEYKNISKINGKMFRYIIPLNKKAKKILKKHYKIMSYPKENDLVFKKRIGNNKYETIEMPKFNMKICTHNYQKWDIKQMKLDI